MIIKHWFLNLRNSFQHDPVEVKPAKGSSPAQENLLLPSKTATTVTPLNSIFTSNHKKIGLVALACTTLAGLCLYSSGGMNSMQRSPCIPFNAQMKLNQHQWFNYTPTDNDPSVNEMPFDPPLYSAMPAQWTDNLLLSQSAIRSRIISTTVFPVFAALDIIDQGIKCSKEQLSTFFSNDIAEKKKHLQLAEQSCQLAKDSLVSFTFSPSGLLIPDIVTRKHLPKIIQKNCIEPYGKLYYAMGNEHRPETIQHIQDIVKMAKEHNLKISIGGTRRSQGKQILPTNPNDVFIDMQHLKAITIDPEKKIAKVQAGSTWADLQAAANPHGLAVQVMQASNIFSVGGSLSANCHGWDHRTGTVSNTIKSMSIIDADGNLKVLKPEEEHFKLVLGGYGLFGVIVEAEIALTDNLMLKEWGERVAPKEYFNYFKEHILPVENILLHYYRLSLKPGNLLDKGVAMSYSANQGEPSTISKLIDEPQSGTRTERVMLQAARRSSFIRSKWWELNEPKMLKESNITRNDLMRAHIQAAFHNSAADTEWLQEYFVKGEDLDNFLVMLKELLIKNKVSLFNASVRYVKQDSLAEMGYAKKGDRFAVVLYFNQALLPEQIEKTKAWIRQVIDYLNEHDGSFYLPYMHFATKEQFQASYPQWEDVAQKKNKYDPDQRFSSGFFEDYMSKN